MEKVAQSTDDLNSQLNEQLQFLVSSAESYDKGIEGEAKRIAITLRILFHETSNQKSLLGQLGKRDQIFYDTAANADIFFSKGKRLGSFAGLVAVTVGQSGKYVPLFDEAPPGFAEYAPFSEFWNRIIFIDANEKKFSRKDIVCYIADQDGGAHVDPKLYAQYYELTRRNSMGLKVSENGSEPISPGRADLAAARQIAHEVLRTLIPDYSRKKMNSWGLPAVPPGILISSDSDPFLKKICEWENLEPYQLCPCKSGRKYKWCCGKK